jgi:hypothetical protein
MHMPRTSVKEMVQSGVKENDAKDYIQRGANTKIFAELATLSISSARSVHPVRRLGESHVHDYTRGARTVAGTMVFALLDRDVFAEVYRDNPMEIKSAAPFYVDQIPKFNIYMAGSNEYGGQGAEALIGITLTNVGKTWSVDDIYTEVTYTYVAQFWLPFVQDYEAFNRMVTLQDEEESKMRAASRILLPGGGRAESVDEREESELNRAIIESSNILLSQSRI